MCCFFRNSASTSVIAFASRLRGAGNSIMDFALFAVPVVVEVVTTIDLNHGDSPAWKLALLRMLRPNHSSIRIVRRGFVTSFLTVATGYELPAPPPHFLRRGKGVKK